MTDEPAVAVTGAAGYIGSGLLDRLRDARPEWDLVALDNFYRDQVQTVGDLEIDEVDVREKDALEDALTGADVVVHLAAVSGVDDCKEDPDLAYETNVQGTSNVAWFCRKTGAAMVFPFSMAVLGDPETYPITADLPRRPMNWYGRTKYAGEQLAETFAKGAFPAHLLMKSNLYGRHRVDDVTVSKPTVTNFFVDRALEGEPLTVYEPGTQSRNYVHVKDVVEAYLLSVDTLLERLAADETGARTYEIASDEDPSVMALAELVSGVAAEERGVDVPVELVENPRDDETLVADFAIDTTRAREELGWRPTHTIEDTVRELLAAE